MAQLPAKPDTAGLINGRFGVDFSRTLGDAAPGQLAYAVHDRLGRHGLMAVQAQPGVLPRASALAALLPAAVPGLLSPLGHGPAPLAAGQEAYFVVCEVPAGRPLSAAPRAWAEHELINLVLRPAAAALEALAARGVTHRAIRLNNVFQGAAAEPVVLGCAWAQPAAFAQPAIYEPPYVAACLPSGRGEGAIADDVYALGVLLIVLALGGDPTEGMTPDAIIRRKLDIGSFGAIAGDRRLPAAIGELARGMLADDPEHRPSPTLLGNPVAAGGRRIAARPPRRAQRPLEFEGQTIWSTRVLAYALGRAPEPAMALLRTGTVSNWLRRSIGDGALASRLDEAERIRAAATGSDGREDSFLLMRSVAILDPLAPFQWPGATLWHDAVGDALVAPAAHDHVTAAQIAAVEDIVKADALPIWAAMRPERCNATAIRTEQRRWRTVLTGTDTGFASLRLAHALNPLLPCSSPLLAGRIVTRPAELLVAFELIAQRGAPKSAPIDGKVAAFLAGRRDDRACSEIPDPGGLATIGADPFAQLRLLARMQASLHPAPLPGLAAWLADVAAPALAQFRSQSRRLRLEAALREQAKTGGLSAMVRCLDEGVERQEDQNGLLAAQYRVWEIDTALAQLEQGRAARNASLRGLSADIAGGTGLLAAGTSMVVGLLTG